MKNGWEGLRWEVYLVVETGGALVGQIGKGEMRMHVPFVHRCSPGDYPSAMSTVSIKPVSIDPKPMEVNLDAQDH